jgi:hypothetical protein
MCSVNCVILWRDNFRVLNKLKKKIVDCERLRRLTVYKMQASPEMCGCVHDSEAKEHVGLFCLVVSILGVVSEAQCWLLEDGSSYQLSCRNFKMEDAVRYQVIQRKC